MDAKEHHEAAANSALRARPSSVLGHQAAATNSPVLRTGSSAEDFVVTPLHKERLDEATELLRRAVSIGESWFRNDLAHEKLALWRNKLAVAYTDQASKITLTAQPPRLWT
ncbi:unnamed protein product [Ectocarpus sp. CCAP 1310/34]|nr:unnamed protein product [Ectocarpus sp. CCAP 1310/34]